MINYQFADGTALVTGAASGIGEALAYALAERGSHLVLVDRNDQRLSAVAAGIRHRCPAIVVHTVTADLGDHEATVYLAQRLAREHPELTLVINNAGVALAGSFTELSLEEFEWLMEINFRAVVTVTHALVPVLLRHPGSHLVNVSSVFGLIAPPGQTAYATSKFAVRGLTESLRAELLGRVGVTCVHPGGIATRIAVDARVSDGADRTEIERGLPVIARLLRIPASEAADIILRGVGRRRPRVLIGMSAVLPDLAVRIAPGSYGRVLAAVLRIGRQRISRG
ncbi:MAG: SDR family oxidoreductase [Microlunatus sp.]|nr:SDR family oxidoreductase [Microlunatus sp.]MDN5770156.1 SDR family oxidoreductase [Microlunatus sp.]